MQIFAFKAGFQKNIQIDAQPGIRICDLCVRLKTVCKVQLPFFTALYLSLHFVRVADRYNPKMPGAGD